MRLFVAAVVIILALGVAGALLMKEPVIAVYKFEEVGDVSLTVKDGLGTLKIYEVGTFLISIDSIEQDLELTIITNQSTRGFPCCFWDYDFGHATECFMSIKWIETGAYQEIAID